MGVHSGNLDVIEKRLEASGLEVELETFEALERFPTREDFTLFWSRMPGHPDYRSGEHAAELDELVSRYETQDGFAVPEWRVVWWAKRGD